MRYTREASFRRAFKESCKLRFFRTGECREPKPKEWFESPANGHPGGTLPVQFFRKNGGRGIKVWILRLAEGEEML